jgi:hypothetical protein
VPLWLVNVYAEMIVVLQAEEAMEQVTLAALAAGSLDHEEAKRIYKDLQRAAKVEAPKRQTSAAAFKQTVAMMGLEVVDVQKE